MNEWGKDRGEQEDRAPRFSYEKDREAEQCTNQPRYGWAKDQRTFQISTSFGDGLAVYPVEF